MNCTAPASHITASPFYRDGYTTHEMSRVFCPYRRMARWLEVECALVASQARQGVVPADAAAALEESADLRRFDLEAIARGIRETNHSLIPLLDQWHKASPPEAAGFIHYGATTQDIQDTAQTLEIRDALAIVLRDLDLVIGETARLAEEHRDTLIVGRTHVQPALPTTLGLKFAVWLDELLRHRQRLIEMAPRALVCQLFGGVGTMSALPGDRERLLADFAAILGLGVPDACWHSSRDRTAETVLFSALAGGTLGKIANEICQLSRDEIGELEEPFHPGKIGSTTMPHKRNPEQCEQVVVLARLLKGCAAGGLDTLINEHERDYRAVRMEWVCLTDALAYLACALAATRRILAGLSVRREALARNLGSSACLVGSEALMFLIAGRIGKKKAHEILYRAAMEARDSGGSFLDAVLRQPEIAGLFSLEELREATSPEKHIGRAGEITDAVVARSKNLTGPPPGLDAPAACPLADPDGGCGLRPVHDKHQGST